jgi:hypothetical protein
LEEFIFKTNGGVTLGQLVEEVRLWNTPAIGAYLLWRFTLGYCNGHPNGDAPIGLLHFLANALLTSDTLCKPISNKRNDLQSYVRSFEDSEDSDILLSIHERVIEKREHTMASIDIAVAEGLLVWDVDSGKLHPRKITKRPARGKGLRAVHDKNGKKAEILGNWIAKHELSTITNYLKVVL